MSLNLTKRKNEDQLLKDYLNLVKWFAYNTLAQLGFRNHEYDDLVQEGKIAVLKANRKHLQKEDTLDKLGAYVFLYLKSTHKNIILKEFKKRTLVKIVSLENLEEEIPTHEAERKVTGLVERVSEKLSDSEIEVLNCIVDPTKELYDLVERDRKVKEEAKKEGKNVRFFNVLRIRRRHIGKYIGKSNAYVSIKLKKIRTVVEKVVNHA